MRNKETTLPHISPTIFFFFTISFRYTTSTRAKSLVRPDLFASPLRTVVQHVLVHIVCGPSDERQLFKSLLNYVMLFIHLQQLSKDLRNYMPRLANIYNALQQLLRIFIRTTPSNNSRKT